MQLALLASYPENSFSNPRFWTQLDAMFGAREDFGRGNLAVLGLMLSDCLLGSQRKAPGDGTALFLFPP